MQRISARLFSARHFSARLLSVRLLGCLLTACVTVVGSPSLGQEQKAEAEPSRPTWHDRVVVTAGRGEQHLAEVSAAVEVFDRQDIDASAALAVDDLLRSHPGFSLFRRSGSLVSHPTTQGVSLRGVGPNGAGRTLVLLDGVPLADPFGGWVYWSQIPRESLDRIEVVSGGGSDLWGSSALGGVIQLLTAPPEDELRWTAEGGEHELAALSAVYGKGWERGALAVEAAATTFGGYRLVAPDQRGAIDVPADLETGHVYLRSDLDLSDTASLQIRANVFREDRGGGTPLTGNETDGRWVSLAATRLTAGREQSGWLSATDHRLDGRFSAQAADRSSESPALEQAVHGTALAAGAQVTMTGKESGRTLVGLEARRLDGATREGFFWSDDEDRFLRRREAGGEQWLAGLYAQRDWQPYPRLRLSAGARAELWADRDGRRIETDVDDGGVRLAELSPDRETVVVSPRLGAVWAVRDELLLRAAVYRAFRAPTINELYRPFRVRNDITAASPELAAERLTGAELGLDRQGRLGGVRLTAFWNRVDDPVANVTVGEGPGAVVPCGFIPAGGVCRQRQNLGALEVEGLEGRGELRPRGGWSLSLSALVERARVVSAPQQQELVGRRVAQVPDWQIVAGISYSGRGPLGALLQTRWVGAQSEDDLNRIRLDPYTVVDLGLHLDLTPRWRLFLKAENLLDERYEVAETGDGIRSLGTPRLVRLGVRLHGGGRR